jgi:hypothetical protein
MLCIIMRYCGVSWFLLLSEEQQLKFAGNGTKEREAATELVISRSGYAEYLRLLCLRFPLYATLLKALPEPAGRVTSGGKEGTAASLDTVIGGLGDTGFAWQLVPQVP